MDKSESIVNLSKALAAAQGEMPAIKFNATNPFLKNHYADLGAVIAGVRPILAKHNLAVTQLVSGEDNVVGVTTMLIHASGEWINETVTLPIGEERGKSSAQVAGSIVTYLRRYALASILGVYSDEDGDGHSPAQTPREKRAVEREREEQADVPVQGDPMTIEDACKVETSDDPPKRYGDLTMTELVARFNELNKQLKDNHLEPSERAIKERKMNAAKMVIDAKRNKEI